MRIFHFLFLVCGPKYEVWLVNIIIIMILFTFCTVADFLEIWWSERERARVLFRLLSDTHTKTNKTCTEKKYD